MITIFYMFLISMTPITIICEVHEDVRVCRAVTDAQYCLPVFPVNDEIPEVYCGYEDDKAVYRVR